jgi:phosphopantothenoylcysteine decarboxylase/phosphopantothenate--cysteine ligase
MVSLIGRQIVVGISGGIAAYKVPNLIRTLIKRGAVVRAVCTKNAEHFVGRTALAALTQGRVASDMFSDDVDWSVEHVALADWAHALLVAPATANVIGKFASGVADDFLSTLYLAVKAPVVLAPAMNDAMWAHPAVRANVALLKKRGVSIVDPALGGLACGREGRGRLADDESLVFHLARALSPADFKGRSVLVTCGGTEEAVDPVRVISNKSSGKMGLAVAHDALRRGAQVTLIHGRMTEPVPPYMNGVRVSSARDMLLAVKKHLPKCDVLVMAAAVSDFTPAAAAPQKIKKTGRDLALSLKETADILKAVSGAGGKRKIVGFALDSRDPAAAARAKLGLKKCHLMVANAPSALGSDRTEIALVTPKGAVSRFPEMPKTEAAKIINDFILKL